MSYILPAAVLLGKVTGLKTHMVCLLQVLIYQALGFREPAFGHVSLILAPDKSKLSKRHGATSVGEFREQGFLPEAMINYLSLLGWNDGTEQACTGSPLCRQTLLEQPCT